MFFHKYNDFGYILEKRLSYNYVVILKMICGIYVKQKNIKSCDKDGIVQFLSHSILF